MDNNSNILNLPFDESDGSAVAYDYSRNRADGAVDGAHFVPGRNGNAIKFTGDGTCTVSKSILAMDSPFTIMCFVNALTIESGSPKQLVWLLNFGDSYEEVPIEVNPETWYNIAMTRSGSSYRFYLNASLVAELTNSGSLVGVSVNQDYYGGEYGLAMLDDCKMFDTAMSQEEITEQLSATKQLSYLIDGVDFKEYGVYVSDSEGVLNRPKLKTPASESWDNYHGMDVDLNHKFYDVREITLSCFIKAKSKNDFIMQVSKFEQVFDRQGTNRLVIDVHPVKPLIYEVYCKDEIAVSKTWNDSLMVGTFKLKLVEPAPVKRILKHIRSGEGNAKCTVKMTTRKYVNIFWGDGSVDYDINGTGVTVEHTYAANGDYFPVITGCIDEITDFTTNAIVVWSKL